MVNTAGVEAWLKYFPSNIILLTFSNKTLLRNKVTVDGLLQDEVTLCREGPNVL